AGNVSPNATPVSATVALGLVMVKLSVVVAFRLMEAAPKAFAIAGGPITVIDAVLLVAPEPLSVDEIGPVVLFCTPACTPVTFSVMVQLEDEPMATPDMLIVEEPAVAVVAATHDAVPVKPFGVATTRPAGKVSVKETLFNWSVVL